jgi:hypothetical protein
MRISTTDAQVEKVGNPKKRSWKLKELSYCMKTKQSAMKLSRRIELHVCLREIILRFEMNLQNLHFSWQFNSYSCFKMSRDIENMIIIIIN